MHESVEQILKYAAVATAAVFVAAMLLQMPGGVLYIICCIGAAMLWGLAQVLRVIFASVVQLSHSTFDFLKRVNRRLSRPPTKDEIRKFLVSDYRETQSTIDSLPINDLEQEDLRQESKEKLKDRIRGNF